MVEEQSLGGEEGVRVVHGTTVWDGCDTSWRTLWCMPPEVMTVRLPRGLEIRVRPIDPSDKELLRLGLERLGDEGSFFRFHRIVRDLTAAELVYLTELDQADHAAWGAAIAGPDDELIPAGVGRYVRLPDGSTAEAAVTVLDEFRQQGVGSFLLQLLARTAMANGITRIVGSVMAENRGMISVFTQLGATVTTDGQDVTVVLDLPFPHEWAPELADGVFEHFRDLEASSTP